ncbi:hypothetical protein [Methanohalobium sp.]|uniref:hypothetical protein n=1 Tax=Methanohalobium sp. TaxID=2837493 RepID=UPI0025DABD27|nr:hypothetical protein [Methanohalobium sp.]
MQNAEPSWDFSPSQPVVGDVLKINGKTSPEFEVNIVISFEKDVPVKDGMYEYIFNNVDIPSPPNRYTVTAKNVENVKFSVKLLFWFTRKRKSSSGVAVFEDSNVPPGTYDTKIHGKANPGESSVRLNIQALQKIKADSGGNFSFSYDTSALPPGDFTLEVNDSAVNVTLYPNK